MHCHHQFHVCIHCWVSGHNWAQYCIGQQFALRFNIVRHNVVLKRVAHWTVHSNALYYYDVHSTVLFCAVHCTVQHSTVLRCTQCCTAQYSTVLYTILYSTVHYCDVHSSVFCCKKILQYCAEYCALFSPILHCTVASTVLYCAVHTVIPHSHNFAPAHLSNIHSDFEQKNVYKD